MRCLIVALVVGALLAGCARGDPAAGPALEACGDVEEDVTETPVGETDEQVRAGITAKFDRLADAAAEASVNDERWNELAAATAEMSQLWAVSDSWDQELVERFTEAVNAYTAQCRRVEAAYGDEG